MRETFREFFPLDEREIADLWRKALFVPDANVLLNVYRYSSETRDTLLAVLAKLSDRLWIPYQFAEEFQRNRLDTILEQIGACRDNEKSLKELEDKLQAQRTHVSKQPTVAATKDSLRVLRDEIQENLAYHRALLHEDPLQRRIAEIFAGRVGPMPAPEQIDSWKGEAEARFDKKIPPGFRDKGNTGDLFGWMQMLGHASESKRGIIFITDDAKDDWWSIVQGERLGPRRELRREFLERTGCAFHMYSTERFVKRAEDELRVDVSGEVLDEIKEISEPPASFRQIEEIVLNIDHSMLERVLADFHGYASLLPEAIRQKMEEALRGRLRQGRTSPTSPSRPSLDAPKSLEGESKPSSEQTPSSGGKEEV